MKLIQKFAKNRKSIGIILSMFILFFAGYFFYLLSQVESAFETPTEFIPTRIYSNVTRIAPPLARGAVEQKLKALGYTTPASGNDLSFVLHSPQYPDYLLPPDHPTLKLKDKRITLHFDGTDSTSGLSSIESEVGEVDHNRTYRRLHCRTIEGKRDSRPEDFPRDRE